MKRFVLVFCAVLLGSLPALAATLSSTARTVIPRDVQQIITVDYRLLRNSPAALALKDRVLPDNLKQFEGALRGMGVDPDMELEQLTFVSYRGQDTLKVVGIAQGQFSPRRVRQRMLKKKVRPQLYREALIYPASGGLSMAFADDFTMVFGDSDAVKTSLDARDGEIESVNSNRQFNDLIASITEGAVWSVLDAAGTQHMMRSALGDAAMLADYEVIKKRFTGSRYIMDFSRGVRFDLDVFTSDTMTAAALSSLVKAGMMYRKMGAEGAEKMALENVSVDSDRGTLKINFRTDDRRFQSLLDSDLFAAVSR